MDNLKKEIENKELEYYSLLKKLSLLRAINNIHYYNRGKLIQGINIDTVDRTYGDYNEISNTISSIKSIIIEIKQLKRDFFGDRYRDYSRDYNYDKIAAQMSEESYNYLKHLSDYVSENNNISDKIKILNKILTQLNFLKMNSENIPNITQLNIKDIKRKLSWNFINNKIFDLLREYLSKYTNVDINNLMSILCDSPPPNCNYTYYTHYKLTELLIYINIINVIINENNSLENSLEDKIKIEFFGQNNPKLIGLFKLYSKHYISTLEDIQKVEQELSQIDRTNNERKYNLTLQRLDKMKEEYKKYNIYRNIVCGLLVKDYHNTCDVISLDRNGTLENKFANATTRYIELYTFIPTANISIQDFQTLQNNNSNLGQLLNSIKNCIELRSKWPEYCRINETAETMFKTLTHTNFVDHCKTLYQTLHIIYEQNIVHIQQLTSEIAIRGERHINETARQTERAIRNENYTVLQNTIRDINNNELYNNEKKQEKIQNILKETIPTRLNRYKNYETYLKILQCMYDPESDCFLKDEATIAGVLRHCIEKNVNPELVTVFQEDFKKALADEFGPDNVKNIICVFSENEEVLRSLIEELKEQQVEPQVEPQIANEDYERLQNQLRELEERLRHAESPARLQELDRARSILVAAMKRNIDQKRYQDKLNAAKRLQATVRRNIDQIRYQEPEIPETVNNNEQAISWIKNIKSNITSGVIRRKNYKNFCSQNNLDMNSDELCKPNPHETLYNNLIRYINSNKKIYILPPIIE